MIYTCKGLENKRQGTKAIEKGEKEGGNSKPKFMLLKYLPHIPSLTLEENKERGTCPAFWQ